MYVELSIKTFQDLIQIKQNKLHRIFNFIEMYWKSITPEKTLPFRNMQCTTDGLTVGEPHSSFS